VVGYVHFGHVITAKQAAVARAESSNRELRRQLADLQSRLAAATAEIDGTQYRLDVIGSEYGTLQGSLTDTEQALQGIVSARARLIAERDDLLAQLQQAQDDASSKADYAAELAKSMEQNKTELSQTEAQRRTLSTRIQQLEKDVQASNTRALEFKAAFDSMQAKLQQISSERERIIAERQRLAVERDELKQKLQSIEARLSKGDTSSRTDTKPAGSVASLPKEAPGKAAGVFSNLESMVAATGLNVENFIARMGGPAKGEGGPYIALGAPKQISSEDQSARDEALKKLLNTLPLAAPLGQYQVERPFGARVDPLNHRQGFHPGVDLVSAFRSPVYSTAPGVVTYAGPRDTYGKFV
jgi:murein DD-endopeptidase MepM/ murein hydrolase activator NlpD